METQILEQLKTTPRFPTSWYYLHERAARKEESEAFLLPSLLWLQAALPPGIHAAEFWRTFNIPVHSDMQFHYRLKYKKDWQLPKRSILPPARQQTALWKHPYKMGCFCQPGSPCTTWNFRDLQHFA